MIDQQVESYCSRFGSNQPAELVDNESTVRGRLAQLDDKGNELEDGIVVDSSLLAINVIQDEESRSLFVNRKAGEEVVFDLKKAYPNDTELAYLLNVSKEEAANVNGNFKLTISEINTFVPAPVDADLFKKVLGEETEISDEPAFREFVASQIKESFVSSSDYRFSIDAKNILLNKFRPELPEAFLKRWLLEANRELTVQQIEDEFQYFIDDLAWQLIKESFVKDNDIKVLEEEVLAFAREMAAAQFRQYGMYNVPEEHLDGFAKRMLEKKEDRNRMFTRVQEQKIFEILKSKITLDEKVVSKEDFEKLFDKN
jgi:trigger factor